MTRFEIAIPESKLAGMKEQIEVALQSGNLDDDDYTPRPEWEDGVDAAALKATCEAWAATYDWRSWERRLNAMGEHHMTEIPGAPEWYRGRKLHYVFVPSAAGADAPPLVLVHGWPGSFFEFYKAVDVLKEHFNLVIPSLPGYAFSQAPTGPGCGPWASAALVHALATRALGYPQYFAQGGDWGAVVVRFLALRYPTECVGVHTNLAVAAPMRDWTDVRTYALNGTMALSALPFLKRAVLADRDVQALERMKRYAETGSGYFLEQSTKPQTLGYALRASPVSTLCWILEKMHLWTDNEGVAHFLSGEGPLTRDEILTNASIYALTDSIASSVRMYRESKHDLIHLSEYVRVPTGVLSAPEEILQAPRAWVAKSYNVKRFTRAPRGGHFFAWEQPEFFANDVVAYFTQDCPFEWAKRCEDDGDGAVARLSLYAQVAAGPLLVAAAARWFRARPAKL